MLDENYNLVQPLDLHHRPVYRRNQRSRGCVCEAQWTHSPWTESTEPLLRNYSHFTSLQFLTLCVVWSVEARLQRWNQRALSPGGSAAPRAHQPAGSSHWTETLQRDADKSSLALLKSRREVRLRSHCSSFIPVFTLTETPENDQNQTQLFIIVFKLSN